MKLWHDGLPETTEYSLFPPSGRLKAWIEDKGRTEARLGEALPGLSFSVVDMSLGNRPAIIPILGEAGEGGRGLYASPPSRERHQEIEAVLARLDI
ncbi:hypothetical protein ASE63_22280 [Bosea sp. Root381]|uniref:hypothetical protein n=1 Tax=Bosea sp. Root381 TaxID=1736524 RepID=UPI0006F3BBF4|nr:hypothetical protein [Bosea sp. Root381]KRE07430.1 hypothetical protein ASE63_22280 [Bosea sp. Root381]